MSPREAWRLAWRKIRADQAGRWAVAGDCDYLWAKAGVSQFYSLLVEVKALQVFIRRKRADWVNDDRGFYAGRDQRGLKGWLKAQREIRHRCRPC